MSETAGTTPASPDESGGAARGRTGGGLSSKLLPELKQIAGGLGIKGISGMKKAQLVEAIRSAQSSGGKSGGQSSGGQSSGGQSGAARPVTSEESRAPATRDTSEPAARDRNGEQSRGRQAQGGGEQDNREQGDREQGNRQQDPGGQDRGGQDRGGQDRGGQDRGGQDRRQGADQAARERGNREQGNREQDQRARRTAESGDQGGRNQPQNQPQNQRSNQSGQQENQGANQPGDQQGGRRNDDDDGNSRRSRRRRGRERSPRDRRQPQDADLEVTEDDVLVPVAGIIDILDNYAFVRTSGYLAGPNDVYVSLSMVRRYGLRKGDAVTGQVKLQREGESRQKFNPLVHLESVNGGDVETAKERVDFAKLTPLYSTERLRLETDQQNLIGRVIDIAAPIGKGQRGLIVSPPKAGKTMILQSIANSITTNNPECHLMIVLVDERPEEVTDFQRTVKGEVIASTFDRPPTDHTAVAELAIERAKRLVELGHDVVILLDGITRLGRAYNLAAPASGRILSGGVDASALYPPKRFFGAARNIEDGGSLTILATALVETGSKMDEVIFEEFKGTGNMELRLRRDFADKRLFPAIDAVHSGTRREELLMGKEEQAIVWKLRRVLAGLDGQQALELLLGRLRKSHNNIEFLTQVQKTTPSPDDI